LRRSNALGEMKKRDSLLRLNTGDIGFSPGRGKVFFESVILR